MTKQGNSQDSMNAALLSYTTKMLILNRIYILDTRICIYK